MAQAKDMTHDVELLYRLGKTFSLNRALTYHLLGALSESDLHRTWPRPGLDTFARHFQEMAAVQQAFVAAIESGTMDFSSVPSVFEFPDKIETPELRQKLLDADLSLQSVLARREISGCVDWDGTGLALDQHLVNLISHEVFHQGMMALAIYAFNAPLPSSWIESWALPPFVRNE